MRPSPPVRQGIPGDRFLHVFLNGGLQNFDFYFPVLRFCNRLAQLLGSRGCEVSPIPRGNEVVFWTNRGVCGDRFQCRCSSVLDRRGQAVAERASKNALEVWNRVDFPADSSS